MEQFAIPSIVHTAPTNQGRPVSAQDWENQRARIQQLYSAEDKSLDEVMSVMETVYGFRATKRQYKRRITQWHLDKNVKDSEIRFMTKKQKTRKVLENKDTSFRVRGRTVHPGKIIRTIKRKNITEDAVMSAPSPVAPTPSDISYATPSDGDHPTPHPPFTPPPQGQNPTPIHGLSSYPILNTSAWNTFAGQNQAPFPTLSSFYESFPGQMPAAFSASIGAPLSLGSHWNVSYMADVCGTSDTLADASNTETKLTRLVELLKESEVVEGAHYMQTMLEVNSIVYDLVTSDANRYNMPFEETPNANHPACSICNTLKKIGNSKMAEKVESERLLLEAIIVSKGLYGDDDSYLFHLRFNLALLYSDWVCREHLFPRLMTRMLKIALRPAVIGTNLHFFICSTNSISWGNSNEVAPFCEFPYLGESLSWVKSLSAILRGRSQLLIYTDEEIQNVQRGLWEMIQKFRRSDMLAFSRPVLRLILEISPPLANYAIYFWIAALFSAVDRQWESIFNSRHILSNAAVQASLSGSITLKEGLDRLAENPFRLEKSANSSALDWISLPNHEGLLSTQQQPEFNDVEKFSERPEDLDGLAVLLAEVSLSEIEKRGNSQIHHSVLDFIDVAPLHDALGAAAQYGNSHLVTLLAKLLTDSDCTYHYQLADILNHDGDAYGFGYDESPLYIAVKAGHEHVVSALIDAGADVNGPADAEQTPLELAADANHRSIVHLLIRKGARAGIGRSYAIY